MQYREPQQNIVELSGRKNGERPAAYIGGGTHPDNVSLEECLGQVLL